MDELIARLRKHNHDPAEMRHILRQNDERLSKAIVRRIEGEFGAAYCGETREIVRIVEQVIRERGR